MFFITIALVLSSAMAGAKIADDDVERNSYVENYKSAKIVKQDFKNLGEGPYRFRFSTSDGIERNEEGTVITMPNGEHMMRVTGSYQYMGMDGKMYGVKYVADENGFHPEGPHIKVAPVETPITVEQEEDKAKITDEVVPSTAIPEQSESIPSAQPTIETITTQPFLIAVEAAPEAGGHVQVAPLPDDDNVARVFANHINSITDGLLEVEETPDGLVQLDDTYLFGGEPAQPHTIIEQN